MNINSKISCKKVLVGKVLSNKMSKTITILVERKIKHKIYGKYIIKSKKYHVDDRDNLYKLGDFVEIQESKPISKTKCWTVLRLIKLASIS